MRGAERSLHTTGGLVSYHLSIRSASAADRTMHTRCASVRVWVAPLVLLAVLTLSVTARAQESDSLIELSLDELLNVEVTSVSKKAEKRREAPAAIYVLTHEDIRLSGDPISNAWVGNAPEHQAVLQNRFDLPHNVDVDATLRDVDALPTLGVDDYIEFDLRLGWQPREDLEFALVGRNLLHDDHFEFAPTFVSQTPTGVQRSVYGQVTWKF